MIIQANLLFIRLSLRESNGESLPRVKALFQDDFLHVANCGYKLIPMGQCRSTLAELG
jgi:hypothetical protein